MRRLTLTLTAGALLGLASCEGHSVNLLSQARDFKRRSSLNLVLELPAGTVRLSRGTLDRLYDLRFSYCQTHFSALERFQPAGERDSGEPDAANLSVEARPTAALHAEGEPNLLDLRLRPGVPLDLRVAAGGDLQADLTGLSVRRLIVHAGAGPTTLLFKAGNPAELGLLRVIGGSGPLSLAGMGWGQVKSLQFHGGAGDAKLDFSGPGPAEAAGLLDPGTGRLELSFPPDLEVEISGRDLDPKSPPAGFREGDRGWVSDNHGRAERRLTLLVEGGAGHLTIGWLR